MSSNWIFQMRPIRLSAVCCMLLVTAFAVTFHAQDEATEPRNWWTPVAEDPV